MAAAGKVWIPFAAPQPVSTLTVLLPFVDQGSPIHTWLFTLVNTGAHPVHFIIETSQDGEAVDRAHRYDIFVQPDDQGSLEVGPSPLRSFWRLSAYTDDPFPVTEVKWQILFRPDYV